MSTLRYPRDLQINSQTDYINFKFFKYEPPFRRGDSGGGSIDYYSSPEGNIGSEVLNEVLLYMPQDVTTSMSTSWGGKEITNMAAGLLAGYANVSSGNLGGAMENVGAGIANLNALPTTAGAALVRMGLSATGAQTNLTQNDILGGTAGIILNPNVELLFGGPSIRNIGFRFKMAARSEKEAQDMIRICRIFQYHAHSSFGGSSNVTQTLLSTFFGQETSTGSNRGEERAADQNATTQPPALTSDQINDFSQSNNFIGVPDLCLFKYMTGENQNEYINQYKACALTNVDVNFTPDGSYSTLIGGYPSALELSLTLVETKIIYKDQINTGLGVSN